MLPVIDVQFEFANRVFSGCVIQSARAVVTADTWLPHPLDFLFLAGGRVGEVGWGC